MDDITTLYLYSTSEEYPENPHYEAQAEDVAALIEYAQQHNDACRWLSWWIEDNDGNEITSDAEVRR